MHADHRQPRSRGPEEGGTRLRPRDRGRAARRLRAASTGTTLTASPSPASWRSTARSGRCPGRSRWPRRRVGRGRRRSSSRPRTRRSGPRRWACGSVPLDRLEQLALLGTEPSRAAGSIRPRWSASGAAPPGPDLADLRGQPYLRYALEVAAAGGHSLLVVGPPGAGKSLAARRLPSIMPPLGRSEAIEVTADRQRRGRRVSPDAPPARPFRAPHHTISTAGLVGGGSPPRAGEVTLPTAGCSSWTSSASSPARPWRRCASRSRRAG